MTDPLFWLALSFLLVVVSLTAVLMVAIPALRELGRAARSAEKFFDTLGRELPPTLEAIRLTSLEITELTDDVTEGVQGAGQVVQQVSQGITTAQTGAKRLNSGTKSFLAGARAAWRAWSDEAPSPQSQRNSKTPPQPQPAPGDRIAPHSDDALAASHGGDRPVPQLEPTTLNAPAENALEPSPRPEAPELLRVRQAPGPNPGNQQQR
ncbi:DUF948 domain-containing protein [Nodosilinea nodulosa]|uniref:DUF948 domain-containing protein n=1 Tax=Nodosilinea nodulosa TaxID=416001 RepID=UPI0002F043A9|nr:DUF948 domain-containing protein [Nodosilinea nodulosa]